MNTLLLFVTAENKTIGISAESKKVPSLDLPKRWDQKFQDLESLKETFMKEFNEQYCKLMQKMEKVDSKVFDPV